MLLKRKYLFGTTILAGVMAVTAPAFAQDQLPGVNVQGQADAQATEIDEVVVTGSRIRRDPTSAPTPLIQVGRDDLLNTGQNTVIDYLAQIPALANSRLPSDTTNTGVDGLGLLGLSTANLRSLGSNRTLVLVDGRRQVGSLQGTLQFDVDTVPRLLIESVEIVTGGASSVYGADAVSGVVNFILRRDYEGLEIDSQYSMINQGGQANKRVSVLGGINLLDDRLNLWGFGEYEQIDEIAISDVDWNVDSPLLITTDVDPAGAVYDGVWDAGFFQNVNTISRPRWGQTTLANIQQPSRLSDPDIPFASCNTTSATGFLQGACYPVDPTRTFVYEGTAARLADFGTRIGTGGQSRTLMLGGDGRNNALFGQQSRTPENESRRFAAGANFDITDNVQLTFDAKYVDEDAGARGQPTFYDMLINDRTAANLVQPQYTYGPSPGNFTFFTTRTDNAFLPANVRAAILANTLTNYAAPTTTADGVAQTPVAAPFARHSMFAQDRTQQTNRTLERYVVGLNGDLDNLFFLKDFNWDISYVVGRAEITSTETGNDAQRFALAADAVVDVGGIVNGRPGEIVCRARLIAASGGHAGDYFRSGAPGSFAATSANTLDLRASPAGTRELNECRPLNVFGEGNQSAEALAYTYGELTSVGINEQEQAIASFSGQLWDFWGAGSIGIALGGEYRREGTEESGRESTAGDRNLFLNSGPDFLYAEYESEEYFAELSIPLLRDSWLGQYAEVSGSYRMFDYTNVGEDEVYGVNLVYRPIRDLAFKSSFNTSFRAPNLGENFSPQSQTFANAFNDPCATAAIALQSVEIRTNRIANCEALAQARGYAPGFFDFANLTPTNTDDFINAGVSVPGLSGGNPLLQPEESESFTFSIVAQPRFIPNFSLVLDYYEVEITNAISSLTAAQIASNCVDGPGLAPTCANIFRLNPIIPGAVTNPDRSQGFQVGDPATSVGFIQGSVNFQGFQTRGMDFTARYNWDMEEAFGVDWGRFDYSVRGSWLMDQKSFTNPSNPASFTEAASGVNLPRVRLSSSLTWTPNDRLSVNWTADWQTAQDIVRIRDVVGTGNVDNRPYEFFDTGNFVRHDFTVRYAVSEELSLRTGVVNAFDAEPPKYLGFADNFDPYGTRFFFGLNYRPF